MSVKVMSYIWEYSRQKGTPLLTLLALADWAHDDGTQAYPSIATLAKKTRMTTRNVQLVLRTLKEAGELQIEEGAGPYGCHLFTVLMTGGEKISGVKKQVKGGEKSRHKTLPKISPNPLEEKPSEEEPLEKIPPIVPPKGEQYSAGFCCFWQTYPVKKQKAQAWKVWRRLRLDPLAAEICASIQAHLDNDTAWKRGYIKYPASYLTAGCWQDEFGGTASTGNPYDLTAWVHAKESAHDA